MDESLASPPPGGNSDRLPPHRRTVLGGLFAGLTVAPSVACAQNRDLVLETRLGRRPVAVRSDARFAGAISSMRVGGSEYVDDNDHGRLFQAAVQFAGAGECLNPTQAGASRDRSRSTSRLVVARVDGASWDVTTQAAYWLRPRDACGRSNGRPLRPLNRTRLSPTLITQRHRFDAFGDLPAVASEMLVTVSEPHETAVVEAFTLYAPPRFSRFELFRDGRLAPDPDVEASPGERPSPVVLSTADGRDAFAFLTRNAEPCGYGRWRFGDCSKLNLVYRPPEGLAPGSRGWAAAWTAGSRDEVLDALRALTA